MHCCSQFSHDAAAAPDDADADDDNDDNDDANNGDNVAASVAASVAAAAFSIPVGKMAIRCIYLAVVAQVDTK